MKTFVRLAQILTAACIVLGAALTAPAAESTAEKLAISPGVRAYGSPRPRAPAGWARFDWEEKRAVLFGQYKPTGAEEQLIAEAVSDVEALPAAEPRKLLVFYRCQYPHASIATGNLCFDRLGLASGAYTPVFTDNPADINPENLAEHDALLLNNTTDFDKTIGPEGRRALLDYVRGGGGLVGVHAAADSCKGWGEGRRLINGVFRCHPWLANGTWAFQLESPRHPLNRPFGGKGFWHRDEVYVYRDGTHSRDASRVLISLDLSQPHNLEAKELKPELKEIADSGETRPVAWVHRFGEGRVFYSNLGHNNATFWQPNVLQHYLAGIQYACGDLKADDTPSDKLDAVEYGRAPDKVAERGKKG